MVMVYVCDSDIFCVRLFVMVVVMCVCMRECVCVCVRVCVCVCVRYVREAEWGDKLQCTHIN